jgi:hypothetical protein
MNNETSPTSTPTTRRASPRVLRHDFIYDDWARAYRYGATALRYAEQAIRKHSRKEALLIIRSFLRYHGIEAARSAKAYAANKPHRTTGRIAA